MRRLIVLALLAAIGYVTYRQLPDIRRYLRIKAM